jgi:hypothetical protein
VPQEGTCALTGELSCGTSVTSAKVSMATAAGTASSRLSQAGAAEAEPADVVCRDEASGGDSNLGVAAFDDLRMLGTSHVEVGVEHLYPSNPAGREVVAPAGLFGILLGKAVSWTQNVRLLSSLTGVLRPSG